LVLIFGVQSLALPCAHPSIHCRNPTFIFPPQATALALSLSLCEKCRTLEELVLQISETLILSSSSTSPSVRLPLTLPLSLSLSLCVCVCVCGSVNLDLQWCVLIGTTADDLYPLFDRYGKVVDVFIPRDRRLGLPLGLPFGFLYSPVYPVCFNNLLVWYDLVAHLMCLCDWCRTGESRGFAFVRYKYQDEAQKAVEKLDGFWFYIFQFFILMN